MLRRLLKKVKINRKNNKLFKNLLTKKFSTKDLLIPHIFLLISVFWFRLVNLGYSDYQGDEVKAMFRVDPTQTLSEFFFSQRKGPMQFVVTYLISFLTPNFYNNFLTRLPFAIAGICSTYFFYKIVKLHFNKKVAVYSSILFSLNGILIAFSRIVQYQSFTILFFLGSIYYFSLALFKKNWKFKGWYIGMLYWAMSALFHYDAIFTSGFVLYILFKWFKKYKDISVKKRLIHVGLSIALCGVLVSLFYIPYAFHIGKSQLGYWAERINDPNAKVSDSLYLFRLYNPFFIPEVYISLFLLSFFKIKKTFPVFLWFIFPFIFMEFIMDIPGTHIYTYFIPVTIMVVFGIEVVENLIIRLLNIKEKLVAKTVNIFLVIYFIFSFSVVHTILIDHTPEYPWFEKNFLTFKLPKLKLTYHLNIFGFPYYRHWEEVADYIKDKNTSVYFGTNEKSSITRFYLEELEKEGELAQHFVFIYGPQSHNRRILQNKPYYWVRILKKEPVKVIRNKDMEVAKIYKMPLGTLEDIR